MSPRDIVIAVLATAMLAASASSARAERLGGAYRGPKVEKTTSRSDDGAQPETEGDTAKSGDATAGSTTDAGTGEAAAGEESGGVDETSGGSSDTKTGKGGGSYRGPAGDAPPDSSSSSGESAGSGAAESGGGSSSQPSSGSCDETTGNSGTSEGGAASGSVAGGVPGIGKKGGAHADRAFQRVLWYFEQNREALLFDVTARAKRSVAARPGSAVGELAVTKTSRRVRTALSGDDRSQVFRTLETHASIDPGAAARDAAVLALGKLGTPEAVEVLLDRLSIESDLEVRQDILLALGMSRSATALPALEKALTDRTLASFALMGLGLSDAGDAAGDVVLAHLGAAMRKDDVRDRADELASAVVALGALRHAAAIDELVALVGDKQADRTLRVHATHAIGNIGGAAARDALFALLEKSPAEVQQAAALALGGFPEAGVAKRLAGKDGIGRPDALTSGFAAISLARVLKTQPEDSWKPYLRELADIALKPQKDPVKSQYANLALALLDRVDAATAEFYGEQYEERRLDDDSKAALTLAAGLGNVRAHGDEFAAIAASDGRVPSMRAYAALALAMVSGPAGRETADRLERVYRGTRDADVRRGAVYGLSIVGDRGDVPFLVSVARDPGDDDYTRGAAALALGAIRDGGTLDAVVKLAENGNPRTRGFALASLGCMVDKDDTPALTRLFRNTNFQYEFPTLRVVMEHL